MNALLELLKLYGTQMSALGAAVAFSFGIYKFHIERRATRYWKEFEVYHKLVKELVEPEKEGGSMFVDRQAAIIYELRNFKRYYPYSLRMLKALKATWISIPKVRPRIIEELDLAIGFIEKKL